MRSITLLLGVAVLAVAIALPMDQLRDQIESRFHIRSDISNANNEIDNKLIAFTGETTTTPNGEITTTPNGEITTPVSVTGTGDVTTINNTDITTPADSSTTEEGGGAGMVVISNVLVAFTLVMTYFR